MLSKLRNLLGKKPETGAVGPTNWALLIRSDGGDATEFLEIRQNARTVWCARGAPYTSGKKELKTFRNMAKAEDFLRQAIAENQAQGLTLLHTGRSYPGAFDFDLFEETVYIGAREAYQRICDDYTGARMSGFALITDWDGMTISPAAMSENSFDDIEEDQVYYRANPSEWPYTTYAGLLLAYRMILVASYECLYIPFEAETPGYFDRFSEACVRALARLDGDGVFGSGARREDFLLLFGVSDGGPTQAALKRLNPETVYRRYAQCFDE